MENDRGFTLLELMFVVVILGILAGIAGVKYQGLYRKAEEGALQGNLGTLRSALAIYYSDLEGQYPQNLDAMTVASRYLKDIPAGRIPDYHAASSNVTLATAVDDSGGWVYNNDTSSVRFGSIWVNCTHTDTKGSAWNSY